MYNFKRLTLIKRAVLKIKTLWFPNAFNNKLIKPQYPLTSAFEKY